MPRSNVFRIDVFLDVSLPSNVQDEGKEKQLANEKCSVVSEGHDKIKIVAYSYIRNLESVDMIQQNINSAP